MRFPVINAKILRTIILKNIYQRLLLKIYLVLLFWFLEDISEVAVCRRSTKSTYPIDSWVIIRIIFSLKKSVNF